MITVINNSSVIPNAQRRNLAFAFGGPHGN